MDNSRYTLVPASAVDDWVDIDGHDHTFVVVREEIVPFTAVEFHLQDDMTFTITPKPEAAPTVDTRSDDDDDDDEALATPNKYTTTPEGGLLRIRAARQFTTRDGAVIFPGELGGLISSTHNLSQDGSAWISASSKAIDRSRVAGDAYITGESIISGDAFIGGGSIRNSTISGHVSISDRVAVNYSHLSGTGSLYQMAAVNNSTLHLKDDYIAGTACLERVSFPNDDSGRERLRLVAGNFRGAALCKATEVLSIDTRWGPLCLYPIKGPRRVGRALAGSVGCQDFTSFHELSALAHEEGTPAEQEFLEPLRQMAYLVGQSFQAVNLDAWKG